MWFKRYLFITIFWIFLLQDTYAQIRLYPILPPALSANSSTARTEMDTVVVKMPFVDDFSSYTGQPNPDLWEKNGGVIISPTQANRPPSENVAVFDGLDSQGKPYNFDFPTAEGVGDQLTSHFIDLSKNSFLNVPYLSFYWKAQGLGEKPDSTDFIRVQFKDGANRWKTKWEVRGSNVVKDSFTYQIIGVKENQGFLHPTFQFRFQTSGRLSGAFDSWVIDYVYMDVRNPEIPDQLDIACSEVPDSFIAPYTAMPIEHYAKDTARYTLDSIYATVNNLHNSFNVFSYDCVLTDISTGEEKQLGLLEVDSLLTTKSVLVQAREKQFKLAAAPNASIIPLYNQDDESLKDSLILKHEFRLRTGSPSDNLATNDTISRTSYLHNYYAYDDGTAEFAAGINQQFGKLAYRYFITQPATITDIDVYFPKIIDDLTGQTFNLFVWKKLDFTQVDPQDEVIVQQKVAFSYTDSINQFRRIKLLKPIEVKDSIFIGWQQLDKRIIAVGLDRNIDSKEEMFFNVANKWEQNTRLKGSLMLRPVFRKDFVLGLEDKHDTPARHITLYPNPANQKVYIHGDAKHAAIYGLGGNFITKKIFNTSDTEKFLDIHNLTQGVYIVVVINQKDIQEMKRLVVY